MVTQDHIILKRESIKIKAALFEFSKFPPEQEKNYDTCICFYTFRYKFLKFSEIFKVVMSSIIY